MSLYASARKNMTEHVKNPSLTFASETVVQEDDGRGKRQRKLAVMFTKTTSNPQKTYKIRAGGNKACNQICY